ncbi:UDP-glucose--hexose-1-phosphate uridylyltransferase [Metabacillus litoralis]|uniref:UDP-glucose--hexose-1-phosphate uridylyltransferase n=1 Tax=Metabacillus litoralis TaxID=152268 RepID=UPI00203FE742|nr:UDP-glucose--hexose-1-phosphate uridylyltransferase [Metabacillus litoralis]MCM3654276.1 UDP-glucose--hexose-1-phosphate uridylyltransferase [Metabacillus litoralis]
MSIFKEIQNLLEYGSKKGLFEKEDEIYVRNRILSFLGLNEWEDCAAENPLPLVVDILDKILDWSFEQGKMETNTTTERDIFDTEIMNCLIARPSEVIREFYDNYQYNPEKATKKYYEMSISSNYIREGRIAKNKQWKTATPYGEIDITINLSKPEKDPKEIALLKDAPASTYPTCLLCIENEGYYGTLRHPARATHRIIPIEINNEDWYLQYSPYVYYNEHCIVLRKQHIPMKISRATFERLLDFTEKFPHYFVGSNADLPIVGGSILAHDHFQGGGYTFAVEKAEIEETFQLQDYPSLTIGIVKWPMSVVRVCGSKEEVANVTEHIWGKWQQYSDPSVDLFSYTGETPHNTVTPIARRRGELYEMDIVLRNNRTSEEHPDGIFHPHQELHHIKKENIGLIEVMGLAVLPGRLANELNQLAKYLTAPIEQSEWKETLLKHWDWYKEILQKYESITKENVMRILEDEVGDKFQMVLEHAGVFKQTDEGKRAFSTFLKTL